MATAVTTRNSTRRHILTTATSADNGRDHAPSGDDPPAINHHPPVARANTPRWSPFSGRLGGDESTAASKK